MTKYEMIAGKIRQRIREEVYPVDSLIPDQVSLAKEFKVSRMTVKKAMDILELEGLILRKRGAGTFVKKTALSEGLTASIMEYEGLTKQLANQEVKSQVISFKLDFPNELTQEKLMLDKHDPIYKIIRLRVVDDAPYILEHTIMNANLIPGINEDILHQSIYDYIHKELNLQFGGAHRIIQADKASEYDQKYLDCDEHDPILEIEQVVYLEDGTPFEYSRSRNKYNTRSYNVVDF
ncbi:GntR family transcriptional regulator [Atopostipes suicloacalis DSM 15692]|uniref:GntR family transcriptional regulator n=1 Tax=Atopostipes suicloacalis DSM 15692 TaxID=1121025 RepID=A0A1M4UG39_9LACT|nr:GntR family transcriptional regulator [Atopostipes suicloacalis]SHE55657.1 GntR family transcriptional regulator [Atopostipes suicloacalis DSM 15692]